MTDSGGEKLVQAVPASATPAISRLRLYLALSRTPHGLLDLATPALAALLCLGGLPPLSVALVGLITVFAGYTAVYALNDVVDYRSDREKFLHGSVDDGEYLDAVYARHPLAQGLLSMTEACLWTGGWALVALAGAYWLNPVCALIFLAGCLIEAIYCLMLGVSELRILVSGVVKTLGGLAAVLAVDPSPSPGFLLSLFLWLFFWEIGGQNIPADWHDLEADRRLQARTVPVRYGPRRAGALVLISLTLSVALSALVFKLSPARFSPAWLALGVGAGCYLLLLPAYRLYLEGTSSQASLLFNQASLYPLAWLGVVTAGIMFCG